MTDDSLIVAVATERIQSRFWAKVRKSYEGCWEWTAARTAGGYGQLNVFGSGKCPVYAHRIAYTMAHGEIPIGQEVCHHCDNPGCVRSDHLFLGSHRENMIDGSKKGRLNVQSKGKPGSANICAKLREEQVPEILAMVASGESKALIGQRFGVSSTTIIRVANGTRWGHVQTCPRHKRLYRPRRASQACLL